MCLKKIYCLVILLCCLIYPNTTYAQADVPTETEMETKTENDMTQEYFAQLEEVDEATEDYLDGTSFTDLIQKILSGELSFSIEDGKEWLMKMAFGEIRTQGKLVMQLLTVSVLAAILRQLSASFANKEVGEMGFYVCYMILIAVVLTTFFEITEALIERVEQTADIFSVMLPVFLALSASSGNLTQTALMGPTLMGGCTLIAILMKTVIVPIVLVAVALEMTDRLSDQPLTSRFAKLLKQCLNWGLKGLAGGFMLLLSLQKLGGGAINSLTVRTAKIAVNAVPVVGDVMGGAVDTVATVTGTLRHGTLVAVVIFFLIFSFPLILKLCAAAAESICEARLVDCIGVAGEYTSLLLGMLFLVEVMLLFGAILLLGVL